MITFFVPGIPKPQPRPRAFVRTTATGSIARVYDCGSAEQWKTQIAVAAQCHLPTQPLSGPIHLGVGLVLPRPKRLNAKKVTDESIPHTSRPDLDNLVKAVMDCLSQLRAWTDDSQVYRITASKHYANRDERTGAYITIIEDIVRTGG